MLSVLTFVLVFHPQVPEAEEIDRLIRTLASESALQRNAASERLLGLGKQAIPALEAAEKNQDLNIKLGAKELLKELAARTRVETYRPSPVRLSVDLVDEPFGKALLALCKPYGLDCPDFDERLADHLVSCRLEQGTIWEVLGIFCKANRCELDGLSLHRGSVRGGGRLYVQPAPLLPFPYSRSLDVGDVRVFLYSGRSSSGGQNKPRRSGLEFSCALTPGTWIENAELVDLRILDDRGLPVKAEREERTHPFDCRRMKGQPTLVSVGMFYFEPSILNPSKTVTVEGQLRLHLPDRVETIATWDSTQPPTFNVGLAAISVEWNESKTVMLCTAKGQTGDDPLCFQIGAYAADGAWLCDLGPYRIEPRTGFQHPVPSPRISRPAKLEAWTVTKTGTRDVPFKFEGVVFNDGK